MSTENPFEPSRFAGGQPNEPVMVNTSLTRTMGILSIVFGSLLLLCGLCSGIYMFAFSAMAQNGGQFQQAIQEARDKQIADLQKQEDVAVDEEAKAEIAQQRAKLEAEKLPDMANISKLYGMSDSRVVTFMGIDIGTALLLNILLLVSGIGLLGLNEWARKLGVLVAAIKVFRLIGLYTFFAVVIVPIMVGQMMEALDEIGKMNPNAPGNQMPPQMATGMGTMWTVYAVGMVLAGVIFPALAWYFLTRPTVRAACQTSTANYQ